MKFILLFILFSSNLFSATNAELEKHFGAALRLYSPGIREVEFVIYQKCFDTNCDELNSIYSFLPRTLNDNKTSYQRLLAKPKPKRNTLISKVDIILAELEADRIWNLRFKNLRSRISILRSCGHPNVINPNAIIRQAQIDRDTVLLDCMEAELALIDTKNSNSKAKRVTSENALKDIKNFDCGTISEPFQLLVCKYLSNR